MNFGSWFSFGIGRQELFFAGIFVFIGLMALLYSITSIKGNNGRLGEYYIFLIVLVGAGLGVVFAHDLLLIFVFWELATVALWRLVSYFRNKEGVEAGLWALYINFAAAAVMLIGLVLIQIQEGSWALQDLAGKPLPFFPAILVLIGILAKSATLPLYIWLPKAYRQAPAPACVLLSGVAENLGLVLFLKLFVLTVKVAGPFFLVSATLAVASGLVAGGVALTTKTIRETLAYSTVGQLGFIFLGFAVAGYYGVMGGLLYVLAHAVAKAGLFFTAGVIEDSRGTGELEKLGGFAQNSPALAGAAGVLVLSIMGLPPTIGFFAKIGVVIGAVQKNILLGIGALIAALFTMLYLSRLYARVFLGKAYQNSTFNRIPPLSIALVIIMAVVTVIFGIFWFLPVRFLEGGL
ncbi:MAG: proton-conducting transporter membrane subunit [candidate division WOR-3 bacterium]